LEKTNKVSLRENYKTALVDRMIKSLLLTESSKQCVRKTFTERSRWHRK